MDWCCCRVSANVDRSSLVIDMNYARSHARCPHTRSILGPVYLINLNSELCSSDVDTVHTVMLKKGKPIAHDSKNPQDEKNLIPLHLCQDTNRTRGSHMIYGYTQSTHTNTDSPQFIQNTSNTSPRESSMPCVCESV